MTLEPDWQEIAERRRSRVTDLERHVVYLTAERDRYIRLLMMALRIASHDGGKCDPFMLLEMCAVLIGTDLSRPAFMEPE